MESTVGPIETAILFFIAFVVPFAILLLDDKKIHDAQT